MSSNPRKHTISAAPGQDAVRCIPNLSSRNLFGDAPEIRIEHLGQIYRLRRTRNGKLLLNK